MKIKLTSILIFIFCLSFGQTNLNVQLRKIIHQTVKRANSKFSESGIDNGFYSKFPNILKKGDTISFYTTSNIPLCDLNVLFFLKSNLATINNFKNCSEPTTISTSSKFYSFKVKKDLLKIYLDSKEYLVFKIVSVEKYKTEKFGKNSYKLNFVVEKLDLKID
ncbi:hypothetical protein [Halpernia frigidisoli]|uniref:Uncharacterized protein n=1 Tax=Halpernia frigidisoli TaxID=1125876 RepID=A0A1I3DJN6_9FLAO|nr:hypothetical protein [Halpernia frigidisoli]SFH86799.1 hypothetical protein SAMN05443292_0506 [Halpernia frigidisoli]